MSPVLIPGHTRALGAPANWTPETSGPCAHLAIRDSHSGDIPVMESAWEPTVAELDALNNGGRVYLRIVGTLHPPVMVYALGPSSDLDALAAARAIANNESATAEELRAALSDLFARFTPEELAGMGYV